MKSNEGRILHAYLESEKIETETVSGALLIKYLGARGIGARLLWDLVGPDIDPLGSENPLIIGAGVLTGTHAPSSGRTTVTCKSPATNLYLKTNVGGHFGAELRLAGYDFLVFHGASSSPKYLLIDGDIAELRDGSDLWGKDVRKTDAELKKRHGDCQVAAIGQGGENLVRFASIMCSIYNAAGRGGAGAVMGSKKLKAIAVKGQGSIEVADPLSFHRQVMSARDALGNDTGALTKLKFGTAGGVVAISELHAFPSYNFREGHFDDAYKISGQRLINEGFLKARVGCNACTISCHRFTEIGDIRTGGPEYETFSALGSGCGVSDMESVIKANDLCNIYGMDTISTGNLIQWAMECYEKGVLTEEDIGFELKWGDGPAVVRLTEQIAKRKGIGDILAEGVKRAAETVGKGSWKWAIEAKGLEQSRVETRSAKSYALAFAVNPRGPDHLHTEPLVEFARSEEALKVVEKICGDRKYATPYSTDKRADIVRWHEDVYAATDSLGLCVFVSTSSYVIDSEVMAELFTAATGIEMTEDELLRAGRRIVTLEKCFNVREGARREDDRLPWRLMNETLPDSSKSSTNTQEELDKMLDEYFTMHAWDLTTGIPKRETLEYLGLDFVIEGFNSRGIF